LGPWETRNQIDDTTGGHQGAIVDLPGGGDYGFVMLDAGAIGRVTNISPIFWEDGWPIWGARETPGRVPASAAKPIMGGLVRQPAASDEFAARELGLQWQWNHNPVDVRWSLVERPGYLRLRPTEAENLWAARNTLVQKAQGPVSRGVVRLDVRRLRAGDRCGLGILGKYSAELAVNGVDRGRRFLSVTVLEHTADGLTSGVRAASQPIDGGAIYLQALLDFTTDEAALSYSADGSAWTEIGGRIPLAFDWRTGTFQGPKYALYCYNARPGDGYLDVDWFHLSGEQ
jgi:beta-xylosidase